MTKKIQTYAKSKTKKKIQINHIFYGLQSSMHIIFGSLQIKKQKLQEFTYSAFDGDKD
jgi:hypothetical protein